MKTLRIIASASLLGLAFAPGCTKKKVEEAPKFDPESLSGQDAKRAGATPIEVNKLVTDNVDFDKSDRTDWKAVELKGRPGELVVELHWDSAQAELSVDVFDSIGVQLASSPAGTGEPAKRVATPIQELGTYFIRIQAPKAGVASDYTLQAKWDGEAVVEAPPPVVKEPPKHHASAPRPKKAAAGSPESGLQGRIVGAHAEGGGLVLYLDKGAAAGVKEGQNGWILSGGSGFDVLEGGTFKVTKVVDDSRSVGSCGLKSIGRNTRVAINVGK